jgi:hypothetical protein
MNRFSVALISNAMSRLAGLSNIVGSDDAITGTFDCVEICKQFNDEFVESFKDVNLSRVLRGQISRISKRLEQGNCSATEIITMFRELHNNVIEELTLSWFLQIPEERRPYYEQRTPLFGSEVAAIFPSATNDISAAGRCLALDEWTACVFHLMRVLEIGLHDLSNRVGLSGDTIELENWKTLIDQIEKKLKSFSQAPKSMTKSEKLQFYSEAASAFSHFKDAWRNHVSHSRANYNEHDALVIFNNVYAFMHSLATHASVLDSL